MRIEQRGKLDVTGEHESLSDDDDYGDDDDGDGPLILQEDSDDDDGALNDDESQVETKSITNFKKFVKKTISVLFIFLKQVNLICLIKHILT